MLGLLLDAVEFSTVFDLEKVLYDLKGADLRDYDELVEVLLEGVFPFFKVLVIERSDCGLFGDRRNLYYFSGYGIAWQKP